MGRRKEYKYSLKIMPQFNDDMVNFSSHEYSSNEDRTHCKTKKTPEELKQSLSMAKQKANNRDVIAKLAKSPDATTTFEDLMVTANVTTTTPVKCQSIRNLGQDGDQPTQIYPRDGSRPVEVSNLIKPSSPLHAGTVLQERQCLFSSTPLQDEISRHGRQYSSTTESDAASRGRQYSSTTVSDIDSENTSPPPPMRIECSQHPGKVLEYWCDQDQEAICSDCGLIGGHKGHDVSKLEQRNEEAVREILLIVPMVAQVLETLVESKKAIEACPKEEMEKIHDKVSAYFQEQIDELQRKEDVMHLQIKHTQQKFASDCTNQVSEIDKHVKNLRTQLKNAENCLKSKKNIPFIDVNGNILDTNELHEQLRNLVLIPCQLNFEEPFCNIDHDGLELNYTKPDLQPLDSHTDQTTLKVESEFEEKSPIKVEDDHDTLVQKNEDIVENLNCSNGKENYTKVVSEFKCQREDNDIVTSDEWKVPIEIKNDRASLSNEAKSKIMERMKTDERSIVLENLDKNVKHVQVSKWAERWGKVGHVHIDKSSLFRWKRRVIFHTAESAKACLAAGKWTFNGTEINVTAPINNYTNSIYCWNLSKRHSALDLLQYMNQFGTVLDVRIDQHRITGDLFAIVSFSSKRERDLAVAYKSHMVNRKIISVNVYGDRSQKKQSLDTKPQMSPRKDILKTNNTLTSLSKSQGTDGLDMSQEKELPLSSSTLLETSIICEVGKASFKNPYAPEVHRTYSGKIVPANVDLESNIVSPVDAQLEVDKTSAITQPLLDSNRVTQIQEKEKGCSANRSFSEDSQKEKDLDEEFYASPVYSKAQLTSAGWVRPVVPTNSSLEVQVTHIDASGTVWVMPVEELRAHRLLTQILTNFCEDLILSPDNMTWRPGQRAVIFHEGVHERAEILTVTTDRTGSKMTVILVDSGKTIHCRSEELLIAPRSGLPFTYPSLAMPVRLYGIVMNASLGQTHIEKVMGRVKHPKCTLALVWSPRNFPLPGTLRYTDADCQEGLAQSGNVAEDLMNLGCGSLVVSFTDWMYDMSLCDVGWMLDESYFGVDTTKAIPSTLPLRAGHWIPCKAITVDDQVRVVGLLPRVEDLGNSISSLSLSILQDAVNCAHKRMALYGPLAEAENAHPSATVGENVLVFSDGEWCRGRVLETTDHGPWVVLVDYICQEQVKPEHVRKVPVDGGLDEYWYLDPVHAIRASWSLTGTETQTDIDLQKDLLLSSVEYFKVVGFKEIGFDDEKHEVVGHFYDQNMRRLI